MRGVALPPVDPAGTAGRAGREGRASSRLIPPQLSRRAADTGNLAARIAGNNPPTTPMSRAQSSPPMSSVGVTAKAKATWLEALPVERRGAVAVEGEPGRAGPDRAAEQGEDHRFEHHRHHHRRGGKPRARRVAISRVRAETAVYMVLKAPKTAPRAIRKVMTNPRPLTMPTSMVD